MLLTLATLVSLNACESQRALFAATFPDGLLVSGDPPDDVIERIVSAGFDVSWLVDRILTPSERAEYERVTATASAEYERVRAPADAEYRRVTAAASAEYERVTDTASAEYERVRARTVWGILAARTYTKE